jgi:hypothetical protein
MAGAQSSLRRLRELVCVAGHPRLYCRAEAKGVDGRGKRGHDGGEIASV